MTDIITRSVWLNKKLLYSSNKIFANLNEQNKNWFSCDFCFYRKFLCHIAGNVKRKYIYYPLLSFVFKNWIILNKIMIFVYKKRKLNARFTLIIFFFFLSYNLFTLRLIYHSKDLWRHTPLLTNRIYKIGNYFSVAISLVKVIVYQFQFQTVVKWIVSKYECILKYIQKQLSLFL